MTITPNWLESPAKVELTQGDLVILMEALSEHRVQQSLAAENLIDREYLEYGVTVASIYYKLRAAFRGPKS